VVCPFVGAGCKNDYMMTKRQQTVNLGDDGADVALASFVADVVELAGLFRRFADEIARQEGQTQTRWYALSVFSAAPLTVSQAARRLGTTRQSVQRTANELLASGLAVTEPNPDHRASPHVVLTAEGQQALRRISKAAMQARRTWFSDRDVNNLAAAHHEVQRLRDALRRAPTQTSERAQP
jgi:DNA-binding MarR family transcriptional regulator